MILSLLWSSFVNGNVELKVSESSEPIVNLISLLSELNREGFFQLLLQMIAIIQKFVDQHNHWETKNVLNTICRSLYNENIYVLVLCFKFRTRIGVHFQLASIRFVGITLRILIFNHVCNLILKCFRTYWFERNSFHAMSTYLRTLDGEVSAFPEY